MVRPVVSTSTARFQASDCRQSEQLLQHLDHVVVSVLVVVQQNDVVEGGLLILIFLPRSGRGDGGHRYLSS